MLSTPPTHRELVRAQRASNFPRPSAALPSMSFIFTDASDQSRSKLEHFVASIYRLEYGAQISHFHERLVGGFGPDGQLQSVLGLTPLANRTAFLEQYLDQPIERYLGSAISSGTRATMAELGNLAALIPGASRAMIRYMTRYLYIRGYQHVVFTATRSLANSFARLHYEPRVIAKADPRRLSTDSYSWGSYYESNPQVMVGDVRAAYAALF